jgi:hypothetical protein
MSTPLTGLSDYEKAKILDHLNGVSSYTMPIHLWLALSTSIPNEDGSNFTEPTIGVDGYARVDIAGSSFWNAAIAGLSDNKAAIAFPEASGSWGTIYAIGLFTAQTGGTLLRGGSLNTPTAIGANQILRFAIGALAEILGS